MDVTAATTVEELEGLRAARSALQTGAVTADLDSTPALPRHGRDATTPLVVHFERGGRPAGLVAARRGPGGLASMIGSREAYRDPNVGTHLLLLLVADLCADPAVRVLDLGFGEAERLFGDEASEEADVAVFAPSHRGVRVNAVRTALGSDMLSRAKRAWRSRLAERSG